MDDFARYLKLLEILKALAETPEVEALHPKAFAHRYSEREQDRLRSIYTFVDQNYHRKIELQEIAQVCNLSKEAFCRYFKKSTTYTFTEFLNRYRISQAKRLLLLGESVSEAAFSAGFESLSYFNRIFKRVTGENPSAFGKPE